MYIYVDVLIIINIYANFFLLKTTARLTHSPVKNSRCIAAAAIGSLFSLIILLPRLGALLLLIIRLLSAALMIVITFGKKPYEPLFEKGLVFLFVCFIFAGIEYGLSVFSGGQNMIWHNSVLYVNISLLTLVISTIISYAAISFFRYYLDGKNSSDEKYTITITKNGRSISLDAVSDTCNNLTDVFTGKPVIVCGRSSLSGLFESTELDAVLSGDNTDYISGWRLIPFSTIASDGMLRTFQPEYVIVCSQESGKRRSADVYIGVVSRDMEYAVFNPKIL
ncbi:MAG: sigma-E processing peptidase SpoIIGA [Oscillospiraceae bacterium]|nr:sigma-E processing peptidase SpoIIGA [Oscillospiraceae bacterium]